MIAVDGLNGSGPAPGIRQQLKYSLGLGDIDAGRLVYGYHLRSSARPTSGLGWSPSDLIPDSWSDGALLLLDPTGTVYTSVAVTQAAVAAAKKAGVDDAIKTVIRAVLGEKVGGKVIAILEILWDAPGAMMEYLGWTIQASYEIVVLVKDHYNDKDALINGIGTIISKSLLNAPGTAELFGTLAAVAGSGVTTAQIKAKLNSMAEKDPMFGINIMMWLVSNAIPPAKLVAKLAQPDELIVDILKLLRTVLREVTRTSLGLSSGQMVVFDKVYGLVILSVSGVQDFVTSLKSMGVAAAKATQLWNDFRSAVMGLDFDKIERSFANMVRELGTKKLPSMVEIEARLRGEITAEMRGQQEADAWAATVQQARAEGSAGPGSSTGPSTGSSGSGAPLSKGKALAIGAGTAAAVLGVGLLIWR